MASVSERLLVFGGFDGDGFLGDMYCASLELGVPKPAA